MEDSCIFCKIVDRTEEAEIIYESPNVIAFKDINPVAPVHVLIIPKKHINSLASVSPQDMGIISEIQMAAPMLADKLGIMEAFRVITYSGQKAGQLINHLKYHLIGGWGEKDPVPQR